MILTDDNWRGFLHGKSIALVGPAAYLEALGLGHVIDSYDLVARVGDMFPREDDQRDYGSKTDIIFDNLCGWINQPPRKIDKPNYLKVLKNNYLRCMAEENQNYKDFIIEQRNHPFILSKIHDRKIYELKKIIGFYPTKGIFSIVDFLSYPIKKLYVTGLSFYQKDFSQRSYADFYWPEGNSVAFEENEQQGSHHFGKEWEFFKSLVKSDPRIEVDLQTLARVV